MELRWILKLKAGKRIRKLQVQYVKGVGFIDVQEVKEPIGDIWIFWTFNLKGKRILMHKVYTATFPLFLEVSKTERGFLKWEHGDGGKCLYYREDPFNGTFQKIPEVWINEDEKFFYENKELFTTFIKQFNQMKARDWAAPTYQETIA